MRTNIVLDDRLVEEAFKATGVKTKKALVQLALEELVASWKRKDLKELKGKIRFAEGYDYKKAREGRAE